jgi:hypothetical protein
MAGQQATHRGMPCLHTDDEATCAPGCLLFAAVHPSEAAQQQQQQLK